jgi:hypothetical protein
MAGLGNFGMSQPHFCATLLQRKAIFIGHIIWLSVLGEIHLDFACLPNLSGHVSWVGDDVNVTSYTLSLPMTGYQRALGRVQGRHVCGARRRRGARGL